MSYFTLDRKLLASFIERSGKSRNRIAVAAGVSPCLISQILSGSVENSTMKTLRKIASAIGRDVREFVTFDDDDVFKSAARGNKEAMRMLSSFYDDKVEHVETDTQKAVAAYCRSRFHRLCESKGKAELERRSGCSLEYINSLDDGVSDIMLMPLAAAVRMFPFMFDFDEIKSGTKGARRTCMKLCGLFVSDNDAERLKDLIIGEMKKQGKDQTSVEP